MATSAPSRRGTCSRESATGFPARARSFGDCFPGTTRARTMSPTRSTSPIFFGRRRSHGRVVLPGPGHVGEGEGARRATQVERGDLVLHLHDQHGVGLAGLERPQPDPLPGVGPGGLALGVDLVRVDPPQVPDQDLPGLGLRRRQPRPPGGHHRGELLLVETLRGAPPSVPLVHQLEVGLEGRLGGALEPREHGDVDLEPVGLHPLGAVALVEVAPDRVGVPGAVGLGLLAELEGLRRLGLGGAGVDGAVLDHAAQDVALAGPGRLQVLHRREPLRGLDQAGQGRCFTNGDVGDPLAEVEPGGLLHAVPPVPEVDLVQVEEEDLVLREVLLEAGGEEELLHLALHPPVGGEQEGLHHLLGDGGAAAGHAAAQQPLHRAARDGQVVHALVLVEPGVLGGEHRPLHDVRDLLEGHHRPPLAGEDERLAAVGGEDARGDERPVVPQPLEVGQLAGPREGERTTGHGEQRQHRERGEREATPAGPAQPGRGARRVLWSGRCVHGGGAER